MHYIQPDTVIRSGLYEVTEDKRTQDKIEKRNGKFYQGNNKTKQDKTKQKRKDNVWAQQGALSV